MSLGDLHPGAAAALRLLTGDELEAAHLMAEGLLASPYQAYNVALFDMRVTGTYIAHRPALNEWAYRKAEDYLNERFLARCNGLPVIWEHPEKDLLNSEEFNKRIIGTVFYPFIKGDEVWAICKIYDAEAIKAMLDGQLSTSPAIVLSESTKLKAEGGDDLLIEGGPKFPDHLAVCSRGVWDKGGDPTGVNMTARADSVEPVAVRDDKLSQIQQRLDSLQLDTAQLNKRTAMMALSRRLTPRKDAMSVPRTRGDEPFLDRAAKAKK